MSRGKIIAGIAMRRANMSMQKHSMSEFDAILEGKPLLTAEQKAIIRARYIGLVLEAETAQWRAGLAHHIFGNAIMIAGVVLAALIPLAEFIGDDGSIAVFWVNWALALSIAILGGFMRLFNVSKKYVLGMTSLEKMRAEGWLFLSEIGRYAKNPDDNFWMFCGRIEKIKDGVVSKIADGAVAQHGIDETEAMTARTARTARLPIIFGPPPARKKKVQTPLVSDDENDVVVDIGVVRTPK